VSGFYDAFDFAEDAMLDAEDEYAYAEERERELEEEEGRKRRANHEAFDTALDNHMYGDGTLGLRIEADGTHRLYRHGD
jgi:hypothetical protein